MTRDVRVPEEVSGTAFPCYALDGSTDKPARTDTERLDWMARCAFEAFHFMGGVRLTYFRDGKLFNHGVWALTLREAIDAAMDAATREAA
jgi:hypothetical protein